MSYHLDFTPAARRELTKLPKDIYAQIKPIALSLRENPRPHGCLKMKGTQEWRIRVGSYRMRYLIDDTAQTVTITSAGHRRESYDDF